jgi:hypothetical protein
MKIFALVLYICSGAANTCLQPFVFNDRFDSAYDCMITGYDESKAKMIEIGLEEFECLPQEIVVPKKKPIIEELT